MIKTLVLLWLIREQLQKWEGFNFAFCVDREIGRGRKSGNSHWEIPKIYWFYLPVSQVLITSLEIFACLYDSAGLGRAYAALAKILAR